MLAAGAAVGRMAGAAYCQSLRCLGLHPSQIMAEGEFDNTVESVRELVAPQLRPTPGASSRFGELQSAISTRLFGLEYDSRLPVMLCYRNRQTRNSALERREEFGSPW